MGLDASMYVEKRTEGGWELVFEPGTDSLYSKRKWYDDRNSTLFAILGFNTEEYPGLEAIAPMRGVPTDLSTELARYYDQEDGPFATSFTLDELLAFDWQGKVYARHSDSPADTYAAIAGEFFTRTIPLAEQEAGGDPGSVRLVIFFSR